MLQQVAKPFRVVLAPATSIQDMGFRCGEQVLCRRDPPPSAAASFLVYCQCNLRRLP